MSQATRLCCANGLRLEFPFPRLTSADGLHDGDVEGGEAVEVSAMSFWPRSFMQFIHWPAGHCVAMSREAWSRRGFRGGSRSISARASGRGTWVRARPRSPLPPRNRPSSWALRFGGAAYKKVCCLPGLPGGVSCQARVDPDRRRPALAPRGVEAGPVQGAGAGRHRPGHVDRLCRWPRDVNPWRALCNKTGRLSNLRASRPPRLPTPNPTTPEIKLADSRSERVGRSPGPLMLQFRARHLFLRRI